MALHSRTTIVVAVGVLLSLVAAAVIVLLASVNSDASPKQSTEERLSVLGPANAERMSAVPAQGRAMLASLAETQLPGNEGPEKVSEVGVAKLPGGDFAVATLG